MLDGAHTKTAPKRYSQRASATTPTPPHYPASWRAPYTVLAELKHRYARAAASPRVCALICRPSSTAARGLPRVPAAGLPKGGEPTPSVAADHRRRAGLVHHIAAGASGPRTAAGASARDCRKPISELSRPPASLRSARVARNGRMTAAPSSTSSSRRARQPAAPPDHAGAGRSAAPTAPSSCAPYALGSRSARMRHPRHLQQEVGGVLGARAVGSGVLEGLGAKRRFGTVVLALWRPHLRARLF